MCRNIKPLFNFNPVATDAEIQAASLQFVRKISGFTAPSKANEEAFNRAVAEVALAARQLMDSLVTTAEPRNREIEIERARARNAKRFGTVKKLES
ncbi:MULTISPECIES: DUF2277 domain-containing protein [Paenibacillus]|uniref:DUF2277 domain-containing protein n=1 Tax=Paenibacillus violae TaxID=3077234 RepID=A0ABU3RCL5_9BACL|nr:MULTISPECIES: DUF2277 domain-containing protein [Paenibacillus]MDU0201567.1 DUF2277 domain-containing protein [Paenibacillus sp. PFR10]MEC0268408.1 DUF2277 domain-containing protein [Paenibacillus anseongense]